MTTQSSLQSPLERKPHPTLRLLLGKYHFNGRFHHALPINCSQSALMKDQTFLSTAAQFHLIPTMCLTASLGKTGGAPEKIKKNLKLTTPVDTKFQRMLFLNLQRLEVSKKHLGNLQQNRRLSLLQNSP